MSTTTEDERIEAHLAKIKSLTKEYQLKHSQGGCSNMEDNSTITQSPSTQSGLTFGAKLVLTFNPSNDDKVTKAKMLCADLADLLHTEMYSGSGEITELQSRLYNHTIGEILNAQMNVVKVLTLKY